MFFANNKLAEIVYSNYYVQKKVFGVNFLKKKFQGILPQGKITKELLINYRIGWLTVALKNKILKNRKKFLMKK